MFDSRLRPLLDPYLERIALNLVQRGITANAVTAAGLAIGVVAALAIALQFYLLGLALLLLSRLCDGLDGAVARAGIKTDYGGFIDIVFDFAFYGLIPLAFIMANPVDNAIAGSVLIFTFYVNGASFLAYSTMAEKRGLQERQRGAKSFLYTTGLTEAAETIAVFVLFCLFPNWFSPLAYLFAAMVVWTTISRIKLAEETFR